MNPVRLLRLRHFLNPYLFSSSPSSRAASTSTARETQSVTLPDGRTLAYAEYGLATGYPVLYFHGFPSSRLEPGSVAHLATRQGLRLIAPDRPGFGLSTFHPGRKITSWPADVSVLASHLGLVRFAILGGSGGGPYALACAQALPHSQMSAVGVLAGAPPWEAGIKDVMWSSWLTALAVNNAPGASTVVVDATVGGTRRLVETEWARRRIEQWLEGMENKVEELRKEKGESAKEADEEDEQSLTIQMRRERLLRRLYEAFSQGSAASVQEAQLLTQRNWGFRFKDVHYDCVQMWHGTHDVNAPVTMIRWMAARLPHCELREYDSTHFTLVSHLEDILRQLVPEKEKEAPRK
jgi:pimeloyl-ACP methyl ester carboxylesterase